MERRNGEMLQCGDRRPLPEVFTRGITYLLPQVKKKIPSPEEVQINNVNSRLYKVPVFRYVDDTRPLR